MCKYALLCTKILCHFLFVDLEPYVNHYVLVIVIKIVVDVELRLKEIYNLNLKKLMKVNIYVYFLIIISYNMYIIP